MTQDELASALNITRTGISKWETDDRIPDAEMLQKLSEALETPVARLLGAELPTEEAQRNEIAEQLAKDQMEKKLSEGVSGEDLDIILAGRPLPGVAHVAKDVGLFDFGGYMLAYNGSHVVDCRTGESLIHETLPEKYYPEIFFYGA